MPIVIEEIVGEIAPQPEPAPEPSRAARDEGSGPDPRVVLSAMRREAWRRARLEAR